MHLKHIYELTLTLDAEKFNNLLNRVYSKSGYCDSSRIVDQTLVSKGVLVVYHDRQYKKKVQLTVNANVLLDGDDPDNGNIEKLIGKLEKRLVAYFGSVYTLDDFNLSKVSLMTDVDVRNRQNVADYIRVLRRIGKVKGFSPLHDNPIDSKTSLCLEGNSNSLEFMICDLESLLRERSRDMDSESKELKAAAKTSVGMLRVEMQLKPKAIWGYTDGLVASTQIADLIAKSQKVFLDTFMRVVPFGDFYKKDEALEIIRQKIPEKKLMWRMIRLVALLPEKKSLLLSQKALSYRRIDELMAAFADIEVSPVTISKRHDVKRLDNLYKFM